MTTTKTAPGVASQALRFISFLRDIFTTILTMTFTTMSFYGPIIWPIILKKCIITVGASGKETLQSDIDMKVKLVSEREKLAANIDCAKIGRGNSQFTIALSNRSVYAIII